MRMPFTPMRDGQSPNESLVATEIREILGQWFNRTRRHARVKMKRRFQLFVEQRFRTEHRVMRKRAAAEQHGVRADETVVTDVDRLRRLSILREIDAVRDDLRTKARDRRERANPHTRGAIDEMPAADPGVLLDD